jgi:formyl-CoA transferase
MGSPTTGMNYYFEAHNRNKKGIAVDLKKEKGREVMYRLVARSDVFLSNYLPETLRKLGLDYESLSRVNPRLIYALASGYGPHGPDKDKPSFDLAAQARSGMMSIVAEAGKPPLDAGIGTADQLGGLMLAYGILAALLARERTGRGQEVCASLLGSMISLQSMWVQSYLCSGVLQEKVPREVARNPFWNTYKARDGRWFILSMARSDEVWEKLCQALNLEELLADPRFKSHEKRLENGPQLIAIFDKVFSNYNRDELLALLDRVGAICAPINTYDAVATDTQVIENEYITEIEHPIMGRCRVVGIPIHFSGTPAKVAQAAPQLGQHTEEILVEICGYTWDEIVDLKEQGVII